MKVSRISIVRRTAFHKGNRRTSHIVGNVVTYTTPDSFALSPDLSDPSSTPLFLAIIERDDDTSELLRLSHPLTGRAPAITNEGYHFVLTDGDKKWYKLLSLGVSNRYTTCFNAVPEKMKETVCQALKALNW